LGFNRLLPTLQEEAIAGEPHHYHPLVGIQAMSPLKENLFDHLFIFENFPLADRIEGLTGEGCKHNTFSPKMTDVEVFEQTNYDFNVEISASHQINITFQYNGNVYDADMVKRIGSHFREAVDRVIDEEGIEIEKISILSWEEKNRILNDFNNSAAEYPGERTLYRLFEDQVEQIPDHIALVFNDRAVTYCHFDEQANRLANYLRIKEGIRVGDRVLVLMDRSIELIIVLMGAMKSRAAYVPMDALQPGERLRVVSNDASIGVVVSLRKYLEKLAHVQPECKMLHSILCIDDPGNDVDKYPAEGPGTGEPGDPAYVMYTSGSSGIPKGVLVKHRTIINTVWWRKNNYEYAPGHVSLQVPPYFFDSSVTDIFTPLLGGARLVLIRDEERSNLAVLRRIIAINNVSHFIVVPVFYNVMLEEIAGDLKYIKMICCAGDNFPDELIRKHFERLPQVRIFNEYGPTENSVNSTAYELKPHSPRALIGKPIDNVAVYVMDRNLSLCPIGITGELCLAGSSLAVGYLNRPELTAEKFIVTRSGWSDLSDSSDRFYKTGDMGRWLPDGNLEFSGRVDSQVKIRGIRVETGEIENQLMKHTDIKETVVQVRQDESGVNYLCAYIVPQSHAHFSFEPERLKEYLSAKLPGYMIPSYFLILEKLPLTPNGKLDINALPVPQTESTEEYTSPRNEIEKKMVAIWEAVLGKNNIGINDNFFYIGGDSIKSIQIMSRMNGAGYKLEMKDIFQYPLISELSPHVKKLQRIPDQSAVAGIIPLTPIQAAFFNASPIDSHHYNQALMFYASAGFDKEVIKKVFVKIQEHHDVLRMTYKKDAESGEFLQVNHGLDYPFSLQEYDLKGRENSFAELGEKINEVQGSIDLEKGPLMKLGLFHLDDGDRLLIVIHHLVIDGLSWRILLEDIAALYEQILAGEKMVLPPKTDSFKLWSEKLQDYTHHKTLLKEKPYWDRLESEIVPHIKKDFPVEEDIVKDTQEISVNLAEAETALLLNKVNRCYKTEIDDILLTALGMAIKKTFGHDRVLISLEGHGRENISQEIDISRTVGWFTTEYPVLMNVSYADDPGRQIKEIKETLRKIPNKGIGYGILKYLTPEEYKQEIDFRLKPQIIFNYLGQFEADVDRVAQISSFKLAGESLGNTQSLRNRRNYEIEVNGMTSGNRLSMTFSYNGRHFKPGTIAAFADNFELVLKHLIAYCSSKENIERTPSDFIYKGLTIERLQQLLDVYPDIEDIYTLSPMQEGMLFHALLDPSSHSYFEQTAFRLQGELDIPLVEKSLNELVKRHPVLRTAFVHKGTERSVQVVLKNRSVDFYYQDISHVIDWEEKENLVREFKANDKKRSFDLSNDTLARASILRLDKSVYEFTWSFHHILMDGWCIGIINNEFFQVYTAYVQGRPHRLPIIKPYQTYIQWLEKQDQEESGLYWENHLDSFAEQTGILQPKLKKDENQTGYSNRKISFQLDSHHTKMLNKMAARYHVTLNTFTQSIWGILLGKYTGKEDVVFGAVVSGRPFELEGVESMVGLFINTIPVRIRFHGAMKFRNLLQTIQAEAIAGEAYHYYPLADIQSRTPLKQNLMDHLFVFENYPIAEQIEGYGSERNKNAESSLPFKLTNADVFEQTNYDLNVILAVSDQLRITLQYNGYAVDDDYVKRIARHYREAFGRVLENPELEIGELTFLSEEEKNRILYEFNDTAAAYPADKTIHQLFVEQALKIPDRVAVVGAGSQTCPITQTCSITLSYNELNEQSNRLANVLIEKGVESEMIVGIMAERSVEMIAGILGILKSGGAYLPIDPEYPQERIDYMLKDSGAKLLAVANDQEGEKVRRWEGEKGRPRRGLHHSSFIIHHSSHLAYIIYTSGTTGKPKGVMVSHINVVRLVKNTNFIEFNSRHRIMQTGALDFDASTFEIWGSLLNGLTLFVVEKEKILAADQLKECLLKYHIATIWMTSPLFNRVIQVDIEVFSGLTNLLVGGDVLSPHHINRLRKRFPLLKVINGYGPTENTTFSTTFLIDKEYTENIPIGKPIANSRAYIVDRYNRLVPVGIAGEIVVGGDGVARGYLNNPELTVEKFIDFHHSSFIIHHSILYRTGDQARWLDDGNIEFLGRIDQQVKIRGFRIELAEIENRLKEHPLIKEAVVINRKDNERQYLCAYIVTGQTLEKGMIPVYRLKEYLEEKLPSYMVPACFVGIDKIPLNANGKIDRNMLPRPLESDFHTGDAYQAPETDMQRTIAAIWQEVLGREKIGIRDNFFDLGGDSLDFVRVANKLREKLDKEIPVVTLFTYATINSLERYLTGVELPSASKTVPDNFVMLNGSPQSEGNIFFIHEILGDVGAYMEFSKQLGDRFTCWGVEAEKLKNYVPRNVSIEEISAKYILQMKEIQPQGPYLLATWSWGGHLGLEMALQLEKMGEKLTFLGFVDCIGPDCQKDIRLEDFTLESERNFLKTLFKAAGKPVDLDKIDDLDRLWTTAVDILTSDAALVGQLRQLLIENALALPDYDDLTGEELIQYLNLNRTHSYASAHYIPGGKIHTQIHYFAANQNTGRIESWKDYCHNPVIYHDVNGDHHSIFRNKEQIAEFAGLFRKVIFPPPPVPGDSSCELRTPISL
ncbi:MAG: hypothetical protein QG657_3590, partial [Acidobacteriota bacterium]|nr:hypothetical protein [Acidobacteriota bacterium]